MKQSRLKEVNLPQTEQPASDWVSKKPRHSASGTKLWSVRFETGFRGPSFQKLQIADLCRDKSGGPDWAATENQFAL